MAKQNCWENRQCGKQDICPATLEARLDGIHGGRNGGRACWAVMETLCNGEVAHSFLDKLTRCTDCDFQQTVCTEEWPNFQFAEIYERLRQREAV